MSSRKTRARDLDRHAAIEIVEAAWADGQLDRESYDERVHRMLRASTLGELEREVADLQTEDVLPWKVRPTAPARPTPPRQKSWGAAAAVLGVAVLAAGFALPGVFGGQDGDSVGNPFDGTFGDSTPTIDPLTRAGFEEFVADLRSETGDEMVFEAWVRSSGVIAEVPAEAVGKRSQSLRWADGEFAEPDSDSHDGERLSLDVLNPARIQEAAELAASLVDEPEPESVTVYLAVEGTGRDRTCMRAWASNEWDESSSVTYDCQGRIVSQESAQ